MNQNPTDAREGEHTAEIDSSRQVAGNPAGAVAGGAAGAAAGAVTGLAAGPVGSLAGAAVGAVAGGLLGARGTTGAGGKVAPPSESNLTASVSPLGTASPSEGSSPADEADPARRAKRDDVHADGQAEAEAERAKAAIENVQQGYEKAPPGAGGEPSFPTGGNVTRGPRGSGG